MGRSCRRGRPRIERVAGKRHKRQPARTWLTAPATAGATGKSSSRMAIVEAEHGTVNPAVKVRSRLEETWFHWTSVPGGRSVDFRIIGRRLIGIETWGGTS